MDTLATALLSIETTGQKESVYNSHKIRMRLQRQTPANLGNKNFTSGKKEDGNVTFPSAEVLFGNGENELTSVDVQVSSQYLGIFKDPFCLEITRIVHVGQERNTLFLLLTSPVCIQAKFVDSELVDTQQIRGAAKTPTKICSRKKTKAVTKTIYYGLRYL